VRVYVANLSGVADSNDDLVDAADRLRLRQEERERRLHSTSWPQAQLTSARLHPAVDLG
jgi:hypothetical protein